MKALRILFLSLLSILVVSGIVYTASPPTPPAGMPAGGLFARYFSNIIGGMLGTGTCPTGQVIVGFSTGAGINYGTPICSTSPGGVSGGNSGQLLVSDGTTGIWKDTGSIVVGNADKVDGLHANELVAAGTSGISTGKVFVVAIDRASNCPTGWYQFDVKDYANNNWSYFQANADGGYLGGVYSWAGAGPYATTATNSSTRYCLIFY